MRCWTHFLATEVGEIRIFNRDEKKQDDMRHKYGGARLEFHMKEIKPMKSRVYLQKIDRDLSAVIRIAMSQTGLLDKLNGASRVALKPNFTYPYYKVGVTTSPQIIRETVKILREYTLHIAIVETDGGYGAWDGAASGFDCGYAPAGKICLCA